MLPLKRKLLSTTVLSLTIGMGVALAASSSSYFSAQAENPCAAKRPVASKAAGGPCNPCAAKGEAGDQIYTIRAGDSLASVAQRIYDDPGLYRMLAEYNKIADPDLIYVGQVIRIPASPCAAQRVAAAADPCAPCSPCAAAGPCAPAAGPCAPCGPCAPAPGPASECEVPRLVQEAAANPCAAVNPCAAQNPCAAANPCSPCAAQNPCAADPCAPCSPCAPAEAVELTPEEGEAAYECIKPDMRAAYTGGLAAAGTCNPCAVAHPCNPCAAQNPCAAAQPCGPCNPCAVVKPANPCNPCAATNPCNPCAASPCGPQAAAAVPDEVAAVAEDYLDWTRVNTVPYVSATHGSRYVNNYPGPEAADAYQRYEDVGTMPAGARIAKDSFTVSPDGQVAVGPLFLMEKMPEGFNAASADWRYAMIMPDGSLFGVTGGPGSEQVQFCAECHAAVAETQDSLFFLPEEFRVTSR